MTSGTLPTSRACAGLTVQHRRMATPSNPRPVTSWNIFVTPGRAPAPSAPITTDASGRAQMSTHAAQERALPVAVPLSRTRVGPGPGGPLAAGSDSAAWKRHGHVARLPADAHVGTSALCCSE